VNDKFQVNKAIHDFNKALIENDYFMNVRNVVYGGSMGQRSSANRSSKLLHYSTLAASQERPYSANPNSVVNYNLYMHQNPELLKAENIESSPQKISEKKKRPKTGKVRSSGIAGGHYLSHYSSNQKEMSSAKKYIRS
jgi:hypothetical protein